MTLIKYRLEVLLICALALFAFIFLQPSDAESQSLRLCDITESKVAIGNEGPITVLAKGSRQWAIIQQPMNASNTVSLSFGEAAVVGEGYQLGQPATSTSVHVQPEDFTFGFAYGLPTSEYVSARTNNGSTTIKVIECK